MAAITEKLIRSRASDTSFSRGKSYYNKDAVSQTVRRGDVLEAVCEGSQDYPYQIYVYLTPAGDLDYATCTCEYSYGGDCKHIVAVLLTYAYEPEKFERRQAIADALAQHTPAELIALIRQMVEKYPDLQMLIDRPIPGKASRNNPLKVDSYVQELRQTLRNYSGWGDHSAINTLYSINRNAKEFASAGDWRSAAAIYRAILAEGMDDDYGMMDDEGDFYVALSELLPELAACLPHLVDDDVERKAILHTLLDADLWDIALGGIGFSETLESDQLFAYARQEDLPELRRKIEAARERARRRPYSDWRLENFEEMLNQLDILEEVDPEVAIQRLRDEGLYFLLIERLLRVGRVTEACEVIETNLKQSHELLRALRLLDAAGETDPALRFALKYVKKRYDRNLVSWLLQIYTRQGHHEAIYAWQLTRMQHEPGLQHYQALQTAAQTVGKWESVRPEIMQHLERAKEYKTLIDIYLHEQAWDEAWATLAKTASAKNQHSWEYSRLDLQIAEASHQHRPEQALPVYLKYVQVEINARSRDRYRQAAEYLKIVRDLYRQTGKTDQWKALIAKIREDYKRLPALQDELRQARL